MNKTTRYSFYMWVVYEKKELNWNDLIDVALCASSIAKIIKYKHM